MSQHLVTVLLEGGRAVAWTRSEDRITKFLSNIKDYKFKDLSWFNHEEDGTCRSIWDDRTAVKILVNSRTYQTPTTVWVGVDEHDMILEANTDFGHLSIDLIPFAEGLRLAGVYQLQEAE